MIVNIIELFTEQWYDVKESLLTGGGAGFEGQAGR